jgi:Helicase HerA, central domain
MSRPAITSALLGLGATAFVTAISLPFDDRIEFRANNRVDSKPAWLVPQKAEFMGIQRGYGGLKICAAIVGTTAMGGVMVISRSQAAREPVRQKIRQYRNQAEEFSAAAESAYQMAIQQQRYKTLLEADQVAFEGEIENAYLESMGIDPNTQPALPGTTLDQVTNPSDKVRDAEVKPAIADTSAPASHGMNLTNYPSVLIYGAPGSGKSTLAGEEIKRRIKAGHRVIVLDPHAAYGAWQGCEVVGAGMDYATIDSKLKDFASEVKQRYKAIATQPDPKFQPLTFVCDEFTNWASRCENSGDFFQAAVSDIRKAEVFALIVSHSRTMPGLGDAKGMAKLRDEALLEIELLGQQDPVTGKAVPKFEALVKLPGQSLGDRTLVKIPRRDEPVTQYPPTVEYLERVYSQEFDIKPPEAKPFEPTSEPLNHTDSEASGSSDCRFTPLNLSRGQAIALIKQLRPELNQTQVIERLWQVTKGGSADWKRAREEYRELIGE